MYKRGTKRDPELYKQNMKIQLKQLAACSVLSLAGSTIQSGSSMMQVSPNNTILQNLYALSLNQTASQNASLSYISLLLGLNTSCTTNVTQLLNSSSGNYTFFAPSDQAFRAIPGFPDFGPNFCDNCGGGGGNKPFSSGGGGLFSRIFQSEKEQPQQCSKGCNDTSLSLNATSPQLMACLPQMLQYHLLNESLTFNATTFGFLNRSSYNLTVLPTLMNSSCLVNLGGKNQGNETMGATGASGTSGNYQVLVFNISSSSGNDSSSGSTGLSGFNVTILHGINSPANVTVFDVASSNGVLHVVDALLIPPANMTETINATYSTSNSTSSNLNNSTSALPSFLNQTDLQMYNNMSGITVFLPDLSGNISSPSSSSSFASFNLTNYIFPSLLYNNRSFEVIGNLSDGVFFQQNLTNLNGENVTILFGRNNAMLFNGSRVTQSNILMKNGVLHVFSPSESIFGANGPNPQANGTPPSALGRILRQ